MLKVGVNVAIIQKNTVLLTKREDCEVWCLPGGHVDTGETIIQAARREIHEEIGLDIPVSHLIGLYSTPHTAAWCQLIALFRADVVGGMVKTQNDEVIAVQYFPVLDLPEMVLWGHQQRIWDAYHKATGIVRVQYVPFAQECSRSELYQLRDQSGLPRDVFYRECFGTVGSTEDRVELEGNLD